jgi:hypothetical protein
LCRPEDKETDMVMVEQSPIGFDFECSCGHTTFALKASGAVECLRCGHGRDPRRPLYGQMRHDEAHADSIR